MPARKQSRRHPLLRDLPEGVWHPQVVGKVKGYPKTAESFERLREKGRLLAEKTNASGAATRQGVPDGWARRRPELFAIRAEYTRKAHKIVTKMIEMGLVLVPVDNAEKGQAALTAAAAIALDHQTYQPRDRTPALRLVMEYTLQKPSQKSEVTLNKAEDFLNSLLDE